MMFSSRRRQSQVLVLLLLPVLAVVGAPAAPGSGAAGQTTVPATAQGGVAAEGPADLQSAVALERALYFGQHFQHGAAEGEAALDRRPDSSELVAWTAANLARLDRAVTREGVLLEARPDDVWGTIALAFT
jgi:hypothetical protein